MKCKKCGGKGYIESHYAKDARFQTIVRQCCDIAAYSRRVMAADPEKAFKDYGKKNPLITRHFDVTSKGIEVKKGPDQNPKGEPCPVIPFRRG